MSLITCYLNLNSITTIRDFYDQIHNIQTTMQNTVVTGKIFEEFAVLVFKLHKHFQNKYKNIWLYDDIPNLIRQQFKLPLKDNGIDILLEEMNGKFIPVQCKFRSNLSTIPWNQVATFPDQCIALILKMNWELQ